VVTGRSFGLRIRDGIEKFGCCPIDERAKYLDALHAFLGVRRCHFIGSIVVMGDDDGHINLMRGEVD
jgi:hypothetical protein